jgi:hypothetical protein
VGTITKGQGTDEITVDTDGLAGQELVATVELSGAPLGCQGSASKTTRVKVPEPTGCAFDRYGDIKFEDEDARLDNLAIQLANDPLTTGYILMSAGQETFENETTERLNRIRSYLVDVREIDTVRILTVDCGFSSELNVKIYIASPGASPPPCTNSLEPLSIKFKKSRPKTSETPR